MIGLFILVAVGLLHCSVHCQFTSLKAFEYHNETINSSLETVQMFGFMSVAFGSIYGKDGNSNEDIECYGGRSCQSLKELETSGYKYSQATRGYLSLAWSQDVTHQAGDCTSDCNAPCLAEAACFEIDSMTLDGQELLCWGARSCNNINGIYNVGANVQAYGTYSLVNTTLYTSGDGSTIDFEFSGYFAGYNTSIYCNDGDTCNLYCYSNACVNLNFICDDSVSTCNVYCNNSDYCANNWNGNNTYNSDYDIYNSVSLVDDSGELLSFLTKTYDEYDWYEDCVEGSQYTCINASSESDCYGESFIDNSESGSSIRQPICCLGYESCYETTINVNNVNADIFCDASYACDGIEINLNNQSSVYIRGRYQFSSKEGTIKNFEKMIVSASHAADPGSYAYVMNGEYLGCFGYVSCKLFEIRNVKNIYATGYGALSDSEIYSNGSDINIYILGYVTQGDGLTIYCEASDRCNIYCLNGTNNECLTNTNITWHTVSSDPTVSPTKAPSAAPTDDYVEYLLAVSVRKNSSESSTNQEDRITFYVRLEGDSADDYQTDWIEIEIDQSLLNENEWTFVNNSIYWLNVGKEDTTLKMVTYSKHDILFDCFYVYLNENDKTYKQSVCRTDTTIERISVSEDEYENGDCVWGEVDFETKNVRVKHSSEDPPCPYSEAGSDNDDSSDDIEYIVEMVTNTVTYMVIFCASCGLLLALMSRWVAEHVAHNASDEPPKSKILKFFLHLSDFWTDIGLTLKWYLTSKYIFAGISSAALLSSIFVSAFGAIKLVGKWSHYHDFSNDYPDRMVNYVKRYNRTIYLFAIMTGLKPAISILQSKLLYHPLFNIPLKENELDGLYNYEVAVVIAETIPQFLLQIGYLVVYGISEDDDLSLLFISMVISVTSMLVEFMVFIGRRQSNGSLSSSKHLSQEIIYDFKFMINSRELRYFHIMTNRKMKRCLDVVFKDKNQPWQSTVTSCKFESECYFVENRLASSEIDVHCQIVISSDKSVKSMEKQVNDCVKNMFDQESETHTKFKTAICRRLRIAFETTTVTRAKSILLTRTDDEVPKLSEMRAVSTFERVATDIVGQSQLSEHIMRHETTRQDNEADNDNNDNNGNNKNEKNETMDSDDIIVYAAKSSLLNTLDGMKETSEPLADEDLDAAIEIMKQETLANENNENNENDENDENDAVDSIASVDIDNMDDEMLDKVTAQLDHDDDTDNE